MSLPGAMTKGLVLYDYLLVPGGAEQVTLAMAQEFAGALGVGFADPRFLSDLSRFPRHYVLGRPVAHPALRALVTMRRFRHTKVMLGQYDWVLYSGVYAPLAVMSQSLGRRIYYCHTPPRFAYDLEEFYLASAAPWQRPLVRALAAHVRHHYVPAVQAMDVIVANSETVRARIRAYTQRNALVIYPPCRVDRFCWHGQADYYLSTARLEPYKRVDLAIQAFRTMPDQRLLVASGGSDLERLRTLAKGAKNIEFLGWVDEAALVGLIGRAIATLYLARDEDFGMSPVESMAAGKPVVGVWEGGVAETVVDGTTGLLVSPDPEAVAAAVRTLTPERARTMRQACEERAQQFGKDRFFSQLRHIITESGMEGDHP